jgi:hypothetical protein
MYAALVAQRHTLFSFRKVFQRLMPYGTYLAIEDEPAAILVSYKGKTVLTIYADRTEGDLSPLAVQELVDTLTSLLPHKDSIHG